MPAIAESTRHAPSRFAEVQCMAISPDYRHMVMGHGNRKIMWADLPSLTQKRSVAIVNGRIACMRYVDARRLLVSSEDRMTRLLDVSSGRSVKSITLQGDTVRALATTPDGQQVLFGGNDGNVQLWDLATGRVRQTMTGHQARVNRVLFCNETQTAVSASDDGTVRIWNLADGAMRSVLPMPTRQVVALAVSDDSQVLAAAADNTIQLWRLPSAQPLHTLNVSQGWVSGLALTPTGCYVLSSGRDGTVIAWESSTGREMHRVRDEGSLIVGLELMGGMVAMTVDDRGKIRGGHLPDHLIEVDSQREELAEVRELEPTGQIDASGAATPTTPPVVAAADPMPKQPVTPSQPSAADVRGMDGGDDQPLVIREFKPRYGEAGDELTVSGRGFTDTQRVVFCYGREEQEARFTVESDTVLKVIVPIGIDDLRTGAAIEVVTAEGVTVTIPCASWGPDPGGISSSVRRAFAFTAQGAWHIPIVRRKRIQPKALRLEYPWHSATWRLDSRVRRGPLAKKSGLLP